MCIDWSIDWILFNSIGFHAFVHFYTKYRQPALRSVLWPFSASLWSCVSTLFRLCLNSSAPVTVWRPARLLPSPPPSLCHQAAICSAAVAFQHRCSHMHFSTAVSLGMLRCLEKCFISGKSYSKVHINVCFFYLLRWNCPWMSLEVWRLAMPTCISLHLMRTTPPSVTLNCILLFCVQVQQRACVSRVCKGLVLLDFDNMITLCKNNTFSRFCRRQLQL